MNSILCIFVREKIVSSFHHSQTFDGILGALYDYKNAYYIDISKNMLHLKALNTLFKESTCYSKFSR